MNSLDGKAFLVTGGAKRVGAAIVRRLHRAGGNVVVHYGTSRAQAEALAAECNAVRAGSAISYGHDLARLDGLKLLVGAALEAFGRLDGLVNNASGFYPTPFGSVTPAAWNELMASNLQAPLFLAQEAAPALKAARGAIVNIVDIHAERPLKNYVVYSAAKAGLAGLTRALALELAPEVRVNGVAPGPIKWPETNEAEFDPAERARILSTTPLGREGGEDEIGKAVLFLLAEADYMTGQILAVDGGRSVYL